MNFVAGERSIEFAGPFVRLIFLCVVGVIMLATATEHTGVSRRRRYIDASCVSHHSEDVGFRQDTTGGLKYDWSSLCSNFAYLHI